MSAELDHIWSLFQAKLAATVDESIYRIWLAPLRARELHGDNLLVEASPQACGWVRDRFGAVLQRCANDILGPDAKLELTADPAPTGEPGRSDRAKRTTTQQSNRGPAGDANDAWPLAHPRLTFEQFVIGDSNRLAHGAALTVAEMPAHAYNPLFICGPPGVGKTHLLQSIAALLIDHQPWLKVRCVTGEAFTNEFLQALSENDAEGFKARFRHIDVLLVDDVQFLERKARTEEEFFHTFDALHESGSQIVLTSDRPPRDLQALEDRLRERFQAGLVADVSPPDFTTRLAILRMRAHHDSIALADPEVLELIAHRVTINVRALEGALIRVVAFSSLTGREITIELAGEVLDNLYPSKRSPSTISDIQATICEQYGISRQELLSSSRTARLLWPRQVAMYLARELTGQSLPSIGREFGGRDHTTVLNAWRRAGQRLSSDPTSREEITRLRTKLDRQ